MIKYTLIALICIAFITSCTPTNPKPEITDFISHVQKAPVDGGFRMQDYWVWGASCILGEDERYHLFASRWPKRYPFMEGYVFYSEIVHAVSETPEGPYTFQSVALPTRGEAYWDGRMTHNPSIIKYDGVYYLYYIGSTYPGFAPSADSLRKIKAIYRTPGYRNIRIGVAKSTSIDGPWHRMDQPILAPQPAGFDSVVVTNPAPCLTKNGEVYLVYRTFIRGQGQRLALAKADHPESEYLRVLQKPITSATIEDPFIWQYNDRFYIIAKDMTGKITGEEHAGVFLKTDDLTEWHLADPPKAYSRTITWDDGSVTTQGSFERPQLLIQNGIPTHLFAATADGPGGYRNADNTWNMVIPLDF